MTHQRQATLNQIGVSCLRFFPGVGTVVYGARTLVDDEANTAFGQWKYVPVRRMTLFMLSVPMQRYYSATLMQSEENQGSAIHISSLYIQIAAPHPVSPKV